MIPCFFTRTATGVLPTDLPVSPWNPTALNGVAVGGLLAALIEEYAPPTAAPLHWARLVIDLLGAVPATELIPRFTMLRDGRQMQMLQVELLAGGRAVARAQALRVRDAATVACETPLGAAMPQDFPLAPPQTLGVLRHTERRVIAPRNRTSGPGALWVKFDHEVIGGVALSPLVRAAMAGDYAAGTGNMLVPQLYNWPNLDISLFLMREPVGEWIMIEATCESAGNGTAISSARLADRSGTFARTHQVVFIEHTDSLPAHAIV